ncbi:MAG: ParB/RepB/Spo0J family partition protein [Chloroflexi bacterium]|nr:MAG: ParB/RepB/Spo0J family partition protein [Chloroflexota bacterium]TME69582.1 MAG: ParB/RepB/Spo0J family partition protein [Chloroflexota bacterium]TMG50599.1 MAG: ParB/RepB/Spo0J family partition protein [Chloroflexota bacterium]
MARSGLGRGLDVLLGQAGGPTRTEAPERPSTNEIPLELVRPNRHQPRTAFDQEGLSELAASISRHGVLQPIVVSADGNGYELVAGHRRVLAARLAGRTTIPAVVRDEVGDRLELALIENLQRTDLNAIETARAYKLLMETYDLTQEQLAERLGKSRSSVANMLRTLTAPQALQDAVIEGKIGEGHLRALLPLPLSEALQALAAVISKGLSVRDAEALARKMVHPTRRGRARPRLRGGDPDLAQITTELRAALGTKVEVLRGRRGGRIAIQFYSDEDFERLYEMLVRAGKV